MNDEEIYDLTMRARQTALAQARADYTHAQNTGDVDMHANSLVEIARIEADMVNIHATAVRHVQSQRGPVQTNRFNLSPEEEAIARNSFAPGGEHVKGPELTPDQMDEIYARNKAKLHRMRATGEYRQTTEQNG